MLRRQGALDADVVVQRAQAGDFRNVSPMLLYAAWKALWDAPEKRESVSDDFYEDYRMTRYVWKGSCPFCADPEGLRRAREALASAKKECFRSLDWRALGRFSWAIGGPCDLCDFYPPAWRPEWRRLVPEGEWKAFLRERRREESFRSALPAPKRGRWFRPPAA